MAIAGMVVRTRRCKGKASSGGRRAQDRQQDPTEGGASARGSSAVLKATDKKRRMRQEQRLWASLPGLPDDPHQEEREVAAGVNSEKEPPFPRENVTGVSQQDHVTRGYQQNADGQTQIPPAKSERVDRKQNWGYSFFQETWRMRLQLLK